MDELEIRTISPALIKAYREAIYVVHLGDCELALQVNHASSHLSNLMTDWEVSTAAFLTAFNPYSEVLDSQENEARQKRMWADAQPMCPKIFPGIGRDKNDQWPHELSMLALGIELQDAQALADQYEQNAFLWITNIQGFVSLKLRHPIAEPTDQELHDWMLGLSQPHMLALLRGAYPDFKWLMTISEAEREHWLFPQYWDLNQPWPLATPDGTAISAGTEMDRMFRLTASGLEKLYS
jgi:Protein of unknown function (DUF3293)